MKLIYKKIKKDKRYLKIISKIQLRASSKRVIVPEIRLTGRWLYESGFEEGKKVIVCVKNNKLVIIPSKK